MCTEAPHRKAAKRRRGAALRGASVLAAALALALVTLAGPTPRLGSISRTTAWAQDRLHESPDATQTGLDVAAAKALDDWLQTPDPILVILVLDGFRSEALDARGPDGEPLMPHVRAIAQDALVFEDCLTGSPQPALGLYHLLTGRRALHGLRNDRSLAATGIAALPQHGFRLRGLCFRQDLYDDPLLGTAFPWLAMAPSAPEPTAAVDGAREEIEAMSRMFDEALAERVPAVLVWVTDLLLPPFHLPARWLAAHDPTPWIGGQRIVRMEDLRRNRLARAQRVAGFDAEMLRRVQSGKNTLEPTWISTTAHAYADSLLGELLAKLDRPEHARRVSVVITATHGTSVRGMESAGGPLDPQMCRVPLTWRVPSESPPSRRVQAPVMLGDVATTLAAATNANAIPPAGAADWRRELPRDRSRWSFISAAGAGPTSSATLGVRLTTSRLTYREVASRRPLLFDVRADPGEFESLARDQTELTRTLGQRVRESLWGDGPEIWVVVKPAGAERIEGGLQLTADTRAVEPLDLEADDELTTRGDIRFHLGGDVAGDGLRVRLQTADPSLRLTLRGPHAAGWPVFVGGHRIRPAAGATWNLEFPRMDLVRALTDQPPASPNAERDGLEPGIHIWIVAPEAELLVR